MMEKCLNCGRDIDSGLSICPYCGNLMRTVEIDPSENEKSVSNDGGEEKNQQNTDSAPQLDQDLDEFKKTDGEFLFQSEQDILQSQLSQPTQTSQPPDYPVEEIKTSNKKKKIVFLVGGIVIAFVVLLAVILLFGRAQKEGGTEGSRKVYTDIEGDAYCFNKKNKLIKIEGEWNGGYITGDGKHIVLTDKDKKLYCFDGKGNNGVQVRSEGGTLITIQNNGFIYTVDTNSDEKDSDTAYRYDFDTEEKTQIGSGIICPAYNSLDVLVYKDQGIYILPEKASELVKVASCEKGNLVQPIGISDNGKMAVWTEKIGSKVSIYVAENNEKVKVSDVELSDKGYDDIFAYFINDGTEVIIGDGTNEQILRKKIGEDCIATKIAGGIFLFDIYSAQGAIVNGKKQVPFCPL